MGRPRQRRTDRRKANQVHYEGEGFYSKESEGYQKRDPHRMPKDALKRNPHAPKKRQGLGNPLGEGLPRMRPIKWRRKKAQWAANRTILSEILPQLFSKHSMEFFNNLPSLGGGREGTVRIAKLAKPIVTANGNRITSVAIKKFEKGAKAGAETQARTLYSLHKLMRYFVEHGVLPKPPFNLSVIETITHHGNFLIMLNLSGKRHVTAERTNMRDRDVLYNYLSHLCKTVTFAETRLLREMQRAGLELPNLDLKADNLICTLDPQGNIRKARILDQSAKSRVRRYRNKSLRILNRAAWKLPQRKH